MTNNNINNQIAQFSPAKRALLEQRLKQKAAQTVAETSIPRLSDRDSAPLSFSQTRMWFLDQLEPGNPAYNRPSNIHITGQLNVTVLEQSLNEIIRRHDVLRTKFPEVDGQPTQVIIPTLTLSLPIIDLSDLPKTQQEEEVQRLATQEAQKPFDLSQLPLIRAALLRQSQEDHILLMTFHHIIFDGWSMGVLIQELAAVYQAFSTGKSNPLPELPIQYADFAQWQRQRFQGEGLQSQLAYWKQQLGDELPVLELPTDRPRAAIQTFRGAKEVLVLPRTLSDALKALSQQEGVTLFMTLLAAFQTLLYRYTGQEDVIVGTPIAGRDRMETEKLIGVFINTLVLRTQIQGNLTFRELLSRVREVALAAYERQDVPFEKLVEKLCLERNLSRPPLFQVLFQLRNFSNDAVKIQGLTIDNCHLKTGIAIIDMALEIEDKSEGLSCLFKYNTDLFDGSTIERIANHFQVLLAGIIATPEQKLWQLPLLTKTEYQQLSIDWNDTQINAIQDQCIHQLFEAQVQRTPDAIAVEFGEHKLTYRELNERANQLAHYLQGLGVKPEVLVGICVERSIEMLVGLLGILKAGGAYVPLDPSYPMERLDYMIVDAQLSLVLTQDKFQPLFSSKNIHQVCLDREWNRIAQESRNNPISQIRPSNLAYIIYTSGSTGKPKGVMIEHQSLVNFIQTAISEYRVSQSDRILQFASISFDAAAEEIYPCLVSGGTLVLRTDEMFGSVTTFLKACQDGKLTILDLPTAYWQQIVSELATTDVVLPESLRLVIIGGERALPESVKLWRERVGNFPQLINTYGPTEATVVATTYPITTSTPINQKVPIGRAIANVQTYILDGNLQPVPIGIPGELHLGGLGLARGYLNRPELTQKTFIANPFSTNPNTRLYKTGDRVRYLKDGNIEFMGRIDNQVKIRGFRIELGEIEVVLSQHPQVQEAVVIAREDQPGNKRLVAYFVANSDQSITDELRSFLKPKLPDYMVPSAFVRLDRLPLTPNGKIDRRALPAPEPEDTLSTNFIPPRTVTEKQLAQIWTSVLGIKKVGLYDNFFELGGHSLLATQVISRIRQVFEVELPLRTLFAAPTVAELSKHLETKGWSQTSQEIHPVTRNQKIPLSFAQQRLWFLDQLEGESATYNISRTLRLVGNLNLTALEQAVQTIVERHETLRTSFQVVDDAPVQIITPQISLNLPVIDLQPFPAAEQFIQVQQVAKQDAQTPFNLTQAPLLRVTLLRLDEQSHVLLLTIHHIISDGWSMGVLIRELSGLYQAFLRGEPNPLPPLSIQYADFAAWQREWLQGDVLRNQLNYWKTQLTDASRRLELPTDYPRPSVQTFRGSKQQFQVNSELTRRLKTFSQQSEATLFMTLLAAFATLLYRYSSQSDIVIGSPIANRNRNEIESLIGFFVNTLALRINLDNHPSFSELLARVRQIALDAYAHQDLPFEKLIEELQPERSLSYSPLFQVMFVLQNAPSSNLELPDLILTSLAVDTETAKFDVTLFMTETELGLRGVWEYNTDLFDGETITRMGSHFQVLLEGIIANPGQIISQLPILTEAERHQLLVEWNNTQTDYAQDKCIHHLVEEQVEKTPEAVAIVFEEQQLTYRELNHRANQLAHYLQTLGVKPDVLVGICVERSLDMIVGLLAILKAGGAYVPIDPTYPTERLAYMLTDAQVSVLLTQQTLSNRLPSTAAYRVSLDTDYLPQDNPWSIENPLSLVKPENLTYVIYTSGSTGQPKGVAINHRSLGNLIKWQLEQSDGGKTLQFSPLSFDVSFQEIFSTLCSGGTLVLISDLDRREPQVLLRLLTEAKIARLFLPFVALQQLAEAADTLDVSSTCLREVITAGEQLQITPSITRFFSQLTDCRLLNQYGPSESHVVTAFTLPKDTNSWQARPPIGCPISNTQIYLLDSHFQPVPIGVPGELHIGGDGLARGYLNQPELTKEKFIPNPFSNEPDARLYKTGDIARYLPDGNIEFIGRIDNQVKLRGFRIELGEIEAVLSQHPQVQEAVVIAREDQPGNKRLVAYFVSNSDQSITDELRSFLKAKLPDYMMPSAFVQLDRLPLTPNGKVDRRALPKPETENTVSSTFVPPRNSIEEQLAAIWSSVLGVERVGIHHNFFELGGHSLLATQVISRIRQVFEVELPLRTLFAAPTVAELGDRIETMRWVIQPFSDNGGDTLSDNEQGEL